MANTDTPHGFKPWGPVKCLNPYSVDASNTPAFFINDMADMDADGNADVSAANSQAMIGSCQSYLAVTTAGTILVADDPYQELQAQDDGSGTPAQTDVFGNMDLVHTHAGSTVTLISGQELDLSSLTPTATAQFQVKDFLNRVDNDSTADYAEYIVHCNEHNYRSTTGV